MIDRRAAKPQLDRVGLTRGAMLAGSVAVLAGSAAGVALTTRVAVADDARDEPVTVSYQSGALRIVAYQYVPTGSGPFPTIVYNHGSRIGHEGESFPFRYIGRMFTAAGFAVLVPERRGYGGSDGPAYDMEVADVGPAFVSRLQEETDDVLATLAYLQTQPAVDTHRLGIMGWSLGGIVSLFAAARSQAFSAVVDQAGGALTWQRSPELRSALRAAAMKVRVPTLCMDARNDATIEAVTAVHDVLAARGIATQLTIYPDFSPSVPHPGTANGHLIFGNEGASVWQDDVVAFLRANIAKQER